MELIKSLIDFILHIDKHLFEIVTTYQSSTYFILFLIVFCETGLVVTPFLPGDSLLFAAGTICGLGLLNPLLLILLLFIAVFLGDNSNYFIGKNIGPKAFEGNIKFLKQEYLTKTQDFYAKHGGKTVIMARFVPIIRTFAPFVAGIGSMTYKRFLSYSIVGSILWINIFIWAGYLLGSNEFVKNNFSLVTLAIIFVSVLPVIFGLIKSRSKNAH
jgi:membrane-associated protein